jgi:hypothetical protein
MPIWCSFEWIHFCCRPDSSKSGMLEALQSSEQIPSVGCCRVGECLSVGQQSRHDR